MHTFLLINICSHFFYVETKTFWNERRPSLVLSEPKHSHFKNINLNAWADLVGFGEVHAPFPWKIHSKVLDTRPVPNKQNIPQGPTPGYNFWIRACNKRRQDIMALSPLHPLILLMTVHYNIVIEINCLIIMYNLDLAQWIQQQTTDPNYQSLKTCTARTFFFL